MAVSFITDELHSASKASMVNTSDTVSSLGLTTRMGLLTVKDALGIEFVQTNNLLTHNRLWGW